MKVILKLLKLNRIYRNLDNLLQCRNFGIKNASFGFDTDVLNIEDSHANVVTVF